MQAPREANSSTCATLPTIALLQADAKPSAIRQTAERIGGADLVLVATPICNAANSRLLKLFLDLLPQDALRGKTVLPLAAGGSLAHFLALDYALKSVLATLGARDILDSVYATDAQLQPVPDGGFAPDAALVARLDRALHPCWVDASRSRRERAATCGRRMCYRGSLRSVRRPGRSDRRTPAKRSS